MNSEERHHLHEHELGKLAVKTQTVLEKHGIAIAAAFAAVLLALIVGGWWVMSAKSSTAAHWTELAAAGTSEEFGAVADKLKGTAPGYWARLREGELVLDEALPKMFSDREAGLTDMKRSQTAFQEVLDGGTAAPEPVRERALFGLARVLESISTGDTEPAIKTWQLLVTEFPTSIYKTYSEQRIKALESGSGKEFYAWFAKQNPKPPEFRRPQDGLPGGGDGTSDLERMLGLPPSPGAAGAKPPAGTTPEAPADDKKIPDTEKPAEAAKPEAPAADKTTPDAEKPAPEKPAAEKPADDKPPADEKPADKPE